MTPKIMAIFSLRNCNRMFIRYLFISLCFVVILNTWKLYRFVNRVETSRVYLGKEKLMTEIDNKKHQVTAQVYQQDVSEVNHQEPPLRHYTGYYQERTNDEYLYSVKLLRIEKRHDRDATALHSLSKSEPYRSRITNIRQMCAKFIKSDYSHLVDAQRLLFDDEHKVVMCVVPKNSCTTWKKTLWFLTRHRNTSGAPLAQNVNNFFEKKIMARLSSKEVLKRINTYTKFMVTRHPLQRLVSAYRNKIQFGEMKPSYRMLSVRDPLEQYLPGISGIYRRGGKEQVAKFVKSHPDFASLSAEKKTNVLDMLAFVNNDSIAFPDFVRLVLLHGHPGYWNRHWRPQYMLCNPCAIDYDYVIRFENLEEDSNRLLSYLQRDKTSEKRIFFPHRTQSVNEDIANKEFDAIPTNQTTRLKKLYHLDFALFNHDVDLV